VASVARGSRPASIARWAEAARKSGAAIEWEIVGEDFEIPHVVDVVLSATGRELSDCVVSLASGASLHAYRVLVSALADAAVARTPIVLRHHVAADPRMPGGIAGSVGIPEAELLDAAVCLGSLLCDGIGDAVSIRSELGAAPAIDLAYRILQGARQRTTRTEYISCPSCGRTLFDLEETTARIKRKTAHLKGVKIAIMGCIVNGPGEMADADFGYVGSGVGQVTLYVGKQIVQRAVPEAEAPDRLVELIREHDQWVEARGETD
jgi:(E)-4-hydroxy-3-methylbut-2-enyl-diphosphate synthase